MLVRGVTQKKGIFAIAVAVVGGLMLSRLTVISPLLGVIALACGVVLALALLIRNVYSLIYGWFVLTGFLFVILYRLLPSEFYPFVGRGIFWGVLLCIIGAWALDNVLSKRRFLRFDDLGIKVTLILFLAWCLLSLFGSLDVVNSVKQISHIAIGLMASYMFFDLFSRDDKNLRQTVGIIFIVVMAISGIVVLAAVQSVVLGLPVYKRISLWFWNTNSLGLLLFMSIPILLTGGLPLLPNKGMRAVAVIFMLLALFLSFSRASWLAGLVSISFLLWRSRIKTSMQAAIVMGLLAAALAVPIVGADVYDFFAGEQYTGRREIWQGAWFAACERPVFGTGIGNWLQVAPHYIQTPWLKQVGTHSVYLQNAAEIGFPSVALMLVFFACFFYASLKIEQQLRTPYLVSVTRGATATLLGILVHGIFENGFLLTAFSAAEFTVILPYIFIAIPFSAQKLEEKGRSEGQASYQSAQNRTRQFLRHPQQSG